MLIDMDRQTTILLLISVKNACKIAKIVEERFQNIAKGIMCYLLGIVLHQKSPKGHDLS